MRIKVPAYVGNKLDGLSKNDFDLQTFKASGPGGQHRNKTETAVRITHIETGISAEATESRSQHRNRQQAFFRLAEKLIEYYSDQIPEPVRSTERARTYNEKRGLVKDHRTGIELPYQSVLDGYLSGFYK